MSASPIDPDGVSPAEQEERVHADVLRECYLLFRDNARKQRILDLSEQPPQLTIGRDHRCDVCLWWDKGISRAHARLERLGEDTWMLVDDGLSRNGSIVNGERLHRRRLLKDRDVLRFGATHVLYRAPSQEGDQTLTLADGRLDHTS